MNVIAFIIGLLIPTILGWLAIRSVEGDRPVLHTIERIAWSAILGPTLMTLVVFFVHLTGVTALTLSGFLLPALVLIAILATYCFRKRWLKFTTYKPLFEPSFGMSKILFVLLILLGLWTGLKFVAGAVDLAWTPTYWDDTFNNWNLRGKLFYQRQAFTLDLPLAEDQKQNIGGVNSYPPSLPMIKTWLSTMRGAWQDSLVNSVHMVWFFALLVAFYFALRRSLPAGFSLLGTYLLTSLPLLIIHAFNPYADVFLAAHLFLVITSLFHSANSSDEEHANTWLRLSALAAGIFAFTKNEAIVLYISLYALLVLLLLLWQRSRGTLDPQKMIRKAIETGLLLAVLALPWLIYKWTHGLSFGNAKYISELAIKFRADAVWAIWYQWTREPNWLILPIVLLFLIVMLRREFLKMPMLLLTAFIVLAFAEQLFTLTFTPLAAEAVMQTGVARAFLQIVPILTFLACLMGYKWWRSAE